MTVKGSFDKQLTGKQWNTKENILKIKAFFSISPFQDPVVTRIKRDQKIPIIGFVANTGGLLGLCMGFSLVSAFEIVYHCMMTVCWTSVHFYRRQTSQRIVQKNNIQQETAMTIAPSQHSNQFDEMVQSYKMQVIFNLICNF